MANHLGISLFVATVLTLILVRRRGAIKAQTQPWVISSIEAQAGREAPNTTPPSSSEEGAVSLWMRVLVSVVILAAALYIIISQHFQSDQQKWAFGALGTILGFWLKG